VLVAPGVQRLGNELPLGRLDLGAVAQFDERLAVSRLGPERELGVLGGGGFLVDGDNVLTSVRSPRGSKSRPLTSRTLRPLNRPGWLHASELRIGLGCMRMSTDPDRDEALARETIAAALAAGVTVFDTAHAYALGESDLGHNERLLADTLRGYKAQTSARVVTKGGMTRPAGAWIPDGRAKALQRDCEASLVALDGVPIDLYLIHAPDPRIPWRTTVRALGRLLDQGLIRHAGLSNVNRHRLDDALDLVPISAVEVALSPHDDGAVRGGIVERCEQLSIAVIAHSPLGGPRRARRLGRRQTAPAEGADTLGATPAELALAWLLDLSPIVVPIPGARRPDTARSAARAAGLTLDPVARNLLRRAFGGHRAPPADPTHATPRGSEVVVVMGVPGAGKSLVASEYAARGYARLNRDERGGTLRELADALDRALSSDVHRIVLDNTYLTRAARSHVIDTANRYGTPVRCVWLDTPLAQAQINLVERMLDQFGTLLAPGELRELARRHPGLLAPTSQMRTFRELEPPATDEGFASVETIEFVRHPARRQAAAGVFVAARALELPGCEDAIEQGDRHAPHLVFDWSPDGTLEALNPAIAKLERLLDGRVEGALCPHPGGPPTCWCRPPLPGLPLAFAHAHDLDPARSTLIGTGPSHRNLAAALGARYIAA
jgi:aryl-alcohol dehydrogenase-like predicted oxidoreductase/predicted kinase